VVLFEVETNVHALEAIIRECEDKRSAVAADAAARLSPAAAAATAVTAVTAVAAASGRRVYVVLVLPPTRHHRSLAAAHPGTIKAAFPASTADIRRALTWADVPWPADGILWLGAGVPLPKSAATRPSNGLRPEQHR
jgi:hypothetical protein